MFQWTLSWVGWFASPGFYAEMGPGAGCDGPEAQVQGRDGQLQVLLILLAIITLHHKSPGISVAEWMPPSREPRSLVLSGLPLAAWTPATLHLQRYSVFFLSSPPRLCRKLTGCSLTCRQLSIQRHFLASRSSSRRSSPLWVHESSFPVTQHMKWRRTAQRGKGSLPKTPPTLATVYRSRFTLRKLSTGLWKDNQSDTRFWVLHVSTNQPTKPNQTKQTTFQKCTK